jgi:deoxycytidylate deaminase
MTERIRCALSIIARCQSHYETLRPESQPRDFAGLCVAERDQPGKRSKQSDGQSQEYDAIEVLCLPEPREQSDPNDTVDTHWIRAVASSAKHGRKTKGVEVICTTSSKKMKLTENSKPHCDSNMSDILMVDLNELKVCNVGEETKTQFEEAEPVELLSGSEESDQSIFPLAVDDYFMTAAILSKSEDDFTGACIVSNDSLHVISLGYCKEEAQPHAELKALLNAKDSRVDLTKCSLYTTKPPCFDCTQAILNAGIRVVVYGDIGEEGLKDDVKELVCKAKACFKYYYCHM